MGGGVDGDYGDDNWTSGDHYSDDDDDGNTGN